MDDEAINIVRRVDQLDGDHQFFCAYTQARPLEAHFSLKIFFFDPLQPATLKGSGWESIASTQNISSTRDIQGYDYTLFPVATDKHDHWFIIIVENFKKLGTGGNCNVYILDPMCNDWD